MARMTNTPSNLPSGVKAGDPRVVRGHGGIGDVEEARAMHNRRDALDGGGEGPAGGSAEPVERDDMIEDVGFAGLGHIDRLER